MQRARKRQRKDVSDASEESTCFMTEFHSSFCLYYVCQKVDAVQIEENRMVPMEPMNGYVGFRDNIEEAVERRRKFDSPNGSIETVEYLTLKIEFSAKAFASYLTRLNNNNESLLKKKKMEWGKWHYYDDFYLFQLDIDGSFWIKYEWCQTGHPFTCINIMPHSRICLQLWYVAEKSEAITIDQKKWIKKDKWNHCVSFRQDMHSAIECRRLQDNPKGSIDVDKYLMLMID